MFKIQSGPKWRPSSQNFNYNNFSKSFDNKKINFNFFLFKETLKDILNLKDNLKLIDPLGGH
jgi:hypothetical protein